MNLRIKKTVVSLAINMSTLEGLYWLQWNTRDSVGKETEYNAMNIGLKYWRGLTRLSL